MKQQRVLFLFKGVIFSLLTLRRYTQCRHLEISQVFGHCFSAKFLLQCVLGVRVEILQTKNKMY